MLRRRLVLLALAALLPLLALAAGLILLSIQQQRATMRAEAVHRVAEALDSVERELRTQVELLAILGQSPTLDGDTPDLKGFHEIASRVRRQLPLWDRVNLADLAGEQVVNTGLPFGAPLQPVVDADTFRKVIETGAPAIGDLTGPGRLGDGRPRVSIRVPVLRDGRVRYVLTATMAPERLAALIAPPGLDPSWRPFLVDSAGRVVAAPRSPGRVGERAGATALTARGMSLEGVYDGVTPDGAPTVTAFSRSPATGWSAHVSIPLTAYNAPLWRSVWLLVGGFAAALAITVVFVMLVRREAQAHRQEALLRERGARMEALGRMTGGVAHDFNNLLMVILGNVEMLQRKSAAAAFERQLGAIRKAAEKGTHLTRELLAFSRADGQQKQLIELNDQIRQLLEMLRQSLRGDIAVELDLSEEPAFVEVDPIQLDLALLNVAVNARDAMPSGGTLQIATRRTTLPGRAREAAIALAIADTGMGVPEEALPHVFEPFFTTKEVGKGTGLGLSQVYGFARSSGGSADIESKVGRGTTVTIYLPEAEPATASMRAAERDTGRSDPNSGRTPLRVLLVDDNDEVRSVAAEFLREAGMEVHALPEAAAALDLLGREPVDVLVSDIVMAGPMDGIALARAVRERAPRLPILLISGYSRSTAAAAELDLTVLAKPFQMGELARTVRSLAAAGGRGELAARPTSATG